MKPIRNIVRPLMAAALFAGAVAAYGDNTASAPAGNPGAPAPSTAAPGQPPKPKTEDEALKMFANADAKRDAAKLGTQERATAAQNAADLALTIARPTVKVSDTAARKPRPPNPQS